MGHPRTIAESETQMRAAAVTLLRKRGIRLNIHRRNPQGIADAIRQLEPKFEDTGNPMSIIRAWLTGPDGEAAPAQQIISTGRPYRMSPALRIAAERAKDQPPMRTLVSNVQNFRQMED